MRHLQDGGAGGARALPLLLEQAAQLGAGQVHHDQRIPERQHGLGVAEVGGQRGVRGLEVLADAAIVHEADLRALGAGRGQHRVGDQVAQRRLAGLVGLARHAGRAEFAERLGQRGAAALLDVRQVAADLRVGRELFRVHHDIPDVDVGHRAADRVDLHRDARQQVPCRIGLGHDAAVDGAQIALVRVAGDDQADRRVESFDDVDHAAGEALAARLVRRFVGLAAFVDQGDEDLGAIGAHLRQALLMASASSMNCKPAIAEATATEAVPCSTAPTTPTLTPLTSSTRAGRHEGLAGGAVEHVRGEIGKARAAEIRHQAAGLAGTRRIAAAGLLAQQFLAALVEFVVADRGQAQAEQVHRFDARLVGPHRGQRRAGADQVARADEQQVLVFLAPGRQRAAQGFDAAGAQGLGLAGGGAGVGVLARFQVAVEVVDGDQVECDRAARGSGAAGGQQGQRKNGQTGARARGNGHDLPLLMETGTRPAWANEIIARRPAHGHLYSLRHKKTAGVATGRSCHRYEIK